MGRPKGSKNKPKLTEKKTEEKKEIEAVSKSFEENLNQFRAFLDVLRGKEDIRQRFSFLFDPKNVKTSSHLTQPQCEFLADAFFVAEVFPMFKPLEKLGVEVGLTSGSWKGERMNQAIEFQRASKGEQSTQVGIFQGIKDKITGKKEAKTVE